MVEHLAQRVTHEVAHPRVGLGVAGQADFERDPLARDVLGEVVAVSFAVRDRRRFDHRVGKQPRAVANTVSVAVGDRLENRFRPVGFASVDGFLQEV